MIGNFVVRLLDADNNLMSWARVQATARQQGNLASCPFFPATATPFIAERDGIVTRYSVEWTDTGVARVHDIDSAPFTVKTGQQMMLSWTMRPIWMVSGTKDVPLPTVTERQPVCIGLPAGGLGASDPRVSR